MKHNLIFAAVMLAFAIGSAVAVCNGGKHHTATLILSIIVAVAYLIDTPPGEQSIFNLIKSKLINLLKRNSNEKYKNRIY